MLNARACVVYYAPAHRKHKSKGVEMNWTDLLKSEIEFSYKATYSLLDLVSDEMLDWKPPTGENWMTMGQLIKHIATACGACFRGFVTGDWGLPEGVGKSDLTPDEMLPTAEKMPAVQSVAEGKKLLSEDEQLAKDMLAVTSEDKLANEIATAPWDQAEMVLGYRLLQMVNHLHSHKGQLFYYLKLQGKPVNTGHLWGM